MKRFLKAIAIAFMCGILVSPLAEASDRRNPSSGGGRGTPTSSTQQRSGGNRPGGERPGGHNSGGNSGHNSGGNRPGGERPVGHKPGHNPGHNPGSQPPSRSPRPPHHPSHGRPAPPPCHPRYTYYAPPRPPRGWYPGPMAPRFSTVLGLTFGTALNISVNALLNSGYDIYSYGDDVVYLHNVSQLNYQWPTAMLYYGNNGLSRGEFVYSTSYCDKSRYNSVYISLVNAYGNPYSVNAITGGVETVWYGPDGRFISLNYQPQYGYDGTLRYFTTLNFGF